jgi:LysM repeat protein
MPTAYFGTVPYSVKPGDTLYGIAHTYNTTIGNILKFNRIADPNKIRAGQTVIVPLAPPEAAVYTVKQGDTLYSIAAAYGTTVSNLVRYNYLAPPYTIYPGQQLIVTASSR